MKFLKIGLRKKKNHTPKWESVPDTFSGLQCNFLILCPFCFEPASLFDVKNLNFNIGDTKLKVSGKDFLVHPRETSSHAVDVAMMCMECGYHDIFGVAIGYEHSLENYERVKRQIEEVTGKPYDEAIRDALENIREEGTREERTGDN